MEAIQQEMEFYLTIFSWTHWYKVDILLQLKNSKLIISQLDRLKINTLIIWQYFLWFEITHFD
jgi:hypothetical protein